MQRGLHKEQRRRRRGSVQSRMLGWAFIKDLLLHLLRAAALRYSYNDVITLLCIYDLVLYEFMTLNRAPICVCHIFQQAIFQYPNKN